MTPPQLILRSIKSNPIFGQWSVGEGLASWQSVNVVVSFVFFFFLLGSDLNHAFLLNSRSHEILQTRCPAATDYRWEISYTEAEQGQSLAVFWKTSSTHAQIRQAKVGMQTHAAFSVWWLLRFSAILTGPAGLSSGLSEPSLQHSQYTENPAVWHNLGHTDEFLRTEAWLQINLRSLCYEVRPNGWNV